jgi:hypothetical protein
MAISVLTGHRNLTRDDAEFSRLYLGESAVTDRLIVDVIYVDSYSSCRHDRSTPSGHPPVTQCLHDAADYGAAVLKGLLHFGIGERSVQRTIQLVDFINRGIRLFGPARPQPVDQYPLAVAGRRPFISASA